MAPLIDSRRGAVGGGLVKVPRRILVPATPFRTEGLRIHMGPDVANDQGFLTPVDWAEIARRSRNPRGRLDAVREAQEGYPLNVTPETMTVEAIRARFPELFSRSR